MARLAEDRTDDLIKIESRISQETYAKLERWRLGMRVVPPRATVIRTLIEDAMANVQVEAGG